MNFFLLKKLIKFLLSIKDCLQNKPESIHLHFRYIEEEIEIRVESIRIELDKMHEKLRHDLDKFKAEIIEYLRFMGVILSLKSFSL